MGSEKTALYRKYRPRGLDEVIGQPHVTDVLKAAAAKNQFGQVYILTGQRGTGKTSVARILAHLINGTGYDADDVDIIEIDAASNGSVDDARSLREHATAAPLQSSHRIYIIDEVHMLSRQAFDALLKLIEEPPAHCVFIMATTEVQKVPDTILSRAQRFHFRPVPPEVVAKHLAEIARAEKIQIEPDALELLARRGGGSFRDAISLLDQLSGFSGKLTRSKVEEILGLTPDSVLADLTESVQNGESGKIAEILAKLKADGVRAAAVAEQLIDYLTAAALENPTFYDLIEKLLDVPKSFSSDVKLLAVLAGFAVKNSAKTSTETRIKPDNSEKNLAKFDASEKTALESSPKNPSASAKTPAAKSVASPTAAPALTASAQDLKNLPEAVREPNSEYQKKSITKTEQTSKSVQAEKTDAGNSAAKAAPSKTGETDLADFSWADVLAEIKKLNPAAGAIAAGAAADWDGQTLTLYFAKKFQFDKMSSDHYKKIFTEACQNLYQKVPDLIVKRGSKPAAESSDENIAKIAKLMGGGEVVSANA